MLTYAIHEFNFIPMKLNVVTFATFPQSLEVIEFKKKT